MVTWVQVLSKTHGLLQEGDICNHTARESQGCTERLIGRSQGKKEHSVNSVNRMCIQGPQSKRSSQLHQRLKGCPLLGTDKPTLSWGFLSSLASTVGIVLGCVTEMAQSGTCGTSVWYVLLRRVKEPDRQTARKVASPSPLPTPTPLLPGGSIAKSQLSWQWRKNVPNYLETI